MNGPDPDTCHPMPGFPHAGFLRPLAADRPNVPVGRLTCYDDPTGPEHFLEKNVLHHYDFVGHRRVIGGGEVPPYTLVGGNPARPTRARFDAATIAALVDVAWWDWPVAGISRNLDAIRGQDLAALGRAA